MNHNYENCMWQLFGEKMDENDINQLDVHAETWILKVLNF